VQLIDSSAAQRYASKVADEQSSWLQHLEQTAQGQAESWGAQSIVSYNSRYKRMHNGQENLG